MQCRKASIQPRSAGNWKLSKLQPPGHCMKSKNYTQLTSILDHWDAGEDPGEAREYRRELVVV